MTDSCPETKTIAAPAPGWWRRFGLALAIALALPLVALGMKLFAEGLTPESVCALCTPPGTTKGLDRPPKTAAHIQDWVDYTAALVPNMSSQELTFEWDRPEDERAKGLKRSMLQLAAEDMQARYAFAIPAILLILVSVPVGIAGLLLLHRAAFRWQSSALGLAGLAAIIGFFYQDSHPVRLFVAEHLLGRAALASQEADSAYPLLTPETWELAFLGVDLATVLAMSGTAIIIALFTWLAVADPGGEGAKARIISRARSFKLALGLGSLVLILAVATAHELLNWSAVLLAPDPRAAVESLASSAGLFWGVQYSLVLVVVAIPAAISIQLDLRRLAVGEDADALARVTRDAGFDFDIRQSLMTLLTLAGPLLTGPALDMLKAVAGG
ncbi:MAG: hypothetical protein AB8B85_00690 [Paracoccaceae bacterium]